MRRFALLAILLLAPAPAFADEAKAPPGVQADGFAIITIEVAQLWDTPGLKPFREALGKLKDPLKNDLEKFSGMKIEEIERATLYWPTAPGQESGAEPYMIFAGRKPLDREKIIETLEAITSEQAAKELGAEIVTIAGKNVYFAKETVVIFADDRTVIRTPALRKSAEPIAEFLKVLAGTKAVAKTGPLADALAAVGKHSIVAAIDLTPVRRLISDIPKFPAEFAPVKSLARAERALIALDFGAAVKASVKLTFFDAETAKKAEPDAKKLAELALGALAGLRKAKDRTPESDAVLLPLFDFAKTALTKAKLKLDDKTLSATMGGEVDAAIKKSLAEFPAWAEAEAARMHTVNNLKQIGLALHTYHDVMNHMPQDVTDKNGKPILSWRVHLLPYMEQDNLYKQLDLTKPWDDAANKKFVEQMPKIFEHTARPTKEKGFTYFQMLTAEKADPAGSPFLVPGRKLELTGVRDGTANTIMAVEAEEAVNWMKPGDVAYDPKKLPKIGDPKTGRFAAGLADGSVRWFDLKKLGEKNLHALITIDGGEVVRIDE